ncbi:MAG: hypothetical protein WCK70_03450 [Chloroflexales bacterium]
MDIICTRCGALIPTDDVNLQHMVARCRSCNAVFRIADQVAQANTSAPKVRSEVPRPESFTVEYLGSTLCIRWRWFTPISILPVVVVLFWFSFIRSWVMDVSSIIPTVIGFVMAYLSLTAFVNTTRVEVSFHALSVRSGPLPALTNLSFLRPYNQLYGPLPASENLSLPRDSIRQFYCIERRHHVKRSTSISYELQAIKADGSPIAVIKNLQNIEQALYIEQELERFLGIKDEPVDGELPR